MGRVINYIQHTEAQYDPNRQEATLGGVVTRYDEDEIIAALRQNGWEVFQRSRVHMVSEVVTVDGDHGHMLGHARQSLCMSVAQKGYKHVVTVQDRETVYPGNYIITGGLIVIEPDEQVMKKLTEDGLKPKRGDE